MSNKDAIQYLQFLRQSVEDGSPFDIAIETAITALGEQPTIEADIDRAAILRMCNEIEMIIVTVCDTGYTLQGGDVEAIMKRTKAIRKELTGDVGTD